VIILPNADKKDNINGSHVKAGSSSNEYLLKFLSCFTTLSKFASKKMDDEIAIKFCQ
jgi:hypothetical protein